MVFFDPRTAADQVMMALKLLLVRVDLTGVCFVLGVTEETVLAWRRRVAHQAEAINRHLLRALPVTHAAARVHTPRRDASPLAGAHASSGGRRDGSRLDLS
jgi:hypothetical protein